MSLKLGRFFSGEIMSKKQSIHEDIVHAMAYDPQIVDALIVSQQQRERIRAMLEATLRHFNLPSPHKEGESQIL
jgi:hypothetical protein